MKRKVKSVHKKETEKIELVVRPVVSSFLLFGLGLFFRLSTQHFMLAEGQVTSSTTPSHSNAAKEWMHFPGQLSTSAVLVTDPNKPEGGIQYVILYHSTEEGRLTLPKLVWIIQSPV